MCNLPMTILATLCLDQRCRGPEAANHHQVSEPFPPHRFEEIPGAMARKDP